MIPVIDGHNDVLTKLAEDGAADDALLSDGTAAITVPSARAGGLAAGLFAMLPRTPEWEVIDKGDGTHEVPLAPAVEFERSVTDVGALTSRLYRAVETSGGAIRLVRDVADLDACLAGEALGAIMHLEGAEPIDAELESLPVWHAAGLRSVGIVWSRPNAFGHGVPFRFPSSPDTGEGLTPAGVALVRRCGELGIAVDVSHLNAKGFWDVARALDGRPLIASHACAHALCPSPRNLTDDQIDAVGAGGGLIGIAYVPDFLRADGAENSDTPLSLIAEHARYVADRIGVDHVALGSDWNGATMPSEIEDAAGLPGVLAALEAVGFESGEIAKVASGNWRRVLAAAWG